LRECGALSQLLPEVAAVDGAGRSAKRGASRPSALLSRALEYAAQREFALPVRYAVLAHRLGGAGATARARAGDGAHAIQDVRCAERISERLKVPVDCRDAARLAARWHRVVVEAPTLPPAALLDLVNAADALRRPERLETLLQTCESDAMSASRPAGDFGAARYVRAALDIVKGVDAGAIARAVPGKSGVPAKAHPDAIALAVRAARLAALRAWKRGAGA
jgi:tRNA nucleotidyltransferase (CCA-adding enzyme)